MTVPIDLARRVWLMVGLLTLGLAGACGLLRGPADAAGALVGSALTLMNFGGLAWVANRALSGAPARVSVLWVGSSGLRLVVLGCLTGLLVTQTGVGVAGLALSLTLVPVAVILTGLRAARVA